MCLPEHANLNTLTITFLILHVTFNFKTDQK